jgi:hypothetical protein
MFELARLKNCVDDGGRSYARYDWNAAFGGLDDDFNHSPPLRPRQIGELAG